MRACARVRVRVGVGLQRRFACCAAPQDEREGGETMRSETIRPCTKRAYLGLLQRVLLQRVRTCRWATQQDFCTANIVTRQ